MRLGGRAVFDEVFEALDLALFLGERRLGRGEHGLPELELLVGPQPPAPLLIGAAAQQRFNAVFSDLLKLFASKEHPLVLFLDDLQWADFASLALIQA